MPTRTPPPRSIERGPLASDDGRVVLDTVGTPARVYVEASTATASRQVRWTTYDSKGYSKTETLTVTANATVVVPLCKTPCVADLPRGTHKLHFGRDDLPNREELDREVVPVSFGPTPTVHRRALGIHPNVKTQMTHGIVSGTWIMTAAAFAGIGGGLTFAGKDEPAQRAGAVMFAGGGAALVAGIIYAILGAPPEQQGVGVQF